MPTQTHAPLPPIEYLQTNADVKERLSQFFICRDNAGCSWYIRAVINWWPLAEKPQEDESLRLLDSFRRFLQTIDFTKLPLQADTVTHITFKLADPSTIPRVHEAHRPETFFIEIRHLMRCDIAVDNMRIRYPVLHKRHRTLPKFHFSCLTETQALDGAIHLVTVDGTEYIHKLIHRTSYYPPDSQHIMDEIDAYMQFRGTPHIAQIAGLVVSEYPYRTHPATPENPVNKAEVIVGFLLPFYAGGSLWSLTNNPMKFAEAMAKHRAQAHFFPGSQTPLLKWARQIASALQSMHAAGKPHMDVKPANVVLDGQNNAVLIDISGSAGWTYEYLSPEMSEIVEDDREIDIMAIPAHVRVQNDCWAYGLILDALARTAADIGGEEVELVRGVAACMMRCKPEERILLEDALTILRE